MEGQQSDQEVGMKTAKYESTWDLALCQLEQRQCKPPPSSYELNSNHAHTRFYTMTESTEIFFYVDDPIVQTQLG
jgi:hypothetical protein